MDNNTAHVSLIIPFNGEYESLLKIIGGVRFWVYKPSEIIIVNTELDTNQSLRLEIKRIIDNDNISLKIIEDPGSFPGRARNVAIEQSTHQLIAFLDSKTLPSKLWLSESLKMIQINSFDLIWGSTCYEANTFLEKAIKYSTYGSNPLRTLPGSLIKRKVFTKAGFFLESIRAGEDGDWIARVVLHEINTSDSEQSLIYNSLLGSNLSSIAKKWFRNYYISARLSHLRNQKDIYFYFISVVLILIAYNWNNLSYDPSISGWNLESIFYIPNITTISLFVIISCYFIFRCFLFPIYKGVTIKEIIYKLPAIIFISLMLDIIKSAAFFTGRLNNFIKRFIKE